LIVLLDSFCSSGAAIDPGFIGRADTNFVELAFALEDKETELRLINVEGHRSAAVFFGLLEAVSWRVGDEAVVVAVLAPILGARVWGF